MAWWDRVDWSDPIQRDCPLNQGLVGWWMGSPNCYGGTRLQDLMNRSHGTLTNMDPATAWVGTEYGPALDFDGVNDHVICSSTPAIAFPISFHAVVSVPSTAAFQRIINRNAGTGNTIAGAWMQVNTGGAIEVGFGNGGVPGSTSRKSFITTAAVSANKTYAISACIYSASSAKVWIGGVEDATTTSGTAASVSSASSTTYIGALWSNGLNYGTVRVYSILSLSREIQQADASSFFGQYLRGFPDALRWLRGRSMVSVQIDISNTFQKNNNKILTGSSLNFYGIKTGGNL